jgi:hypothetical protein
VKEYSCFRILVVQSTKFGPLFHGKKGTNIISTTVVEKKSFNISSGRLM